MQSKCEKCGRPFQKQRSNSQNRYYWGVIVEILSEHTGFTREEMHEILKHKFLKTFGIMNTNNGPQEFERTKSTTELSTKEMEEFLSQVRVWASAELGCWIPEPNEEVGV
ncbi:MAG TPA: hypothetical protein V6D12_14315 [Candidatus Obscuribacterales bacterium]